MGELLERYSGTAFALVPDIWTLNISPSWKIWFRWPSPPAPRRC
jgi:hypothetical protein